MDWRNKSSNRFLSSSSWSSSPFPIISAISTSTLWNNQHLCISHTQKHERVHSFYININSCQRITFSRSSGPGAQIKIFTTWTIKETLDAMKFGAFSVFDNKNLFTRSWSKMKSVLWHFFHSSLKTHLGEFWGLQQKTTFHKKLINHGRNGGWNWLTVKHPWYVSSRVFFRV